MLQWFRKQQPSDSPGGNQSADLHIALTRKLIDFLESQISSPKKATSLLSQIARFKELPPTYQEKELPSLYLKIERYLVEEDSLKKFTKPQLRKTVQYRYEPLMELENFSLVFEPESAQELLLSQAFLKGLMVKTGALVDPTEEAVLNPVAEWIYHVPEVAHLPMPYGLKDSIPQSFSEWIPLLAKVSQNIFSYLEGKIGEEEATIQFEKTYRELSEIYRPLEAFYVIVQLLPDSLLDETKIGVLSGDQIRNVFLNKLDHMQKTNDDLTNQNAELEDVHSDLIIAQDTALESVKLFHSVLDTVEEGIVTADTTGKIIMMNKQILQIFGYEEEELIGQNIQVLMPEKYREQHRQGMTRYMETKESRAIGQKLVMEGVKKDQTVFPIDIQITETRISEQLYFTAAIRDISEEVKHETEFKKASSDLRLSEQKYRSLIDKMPDIIFTLSLDGAFTLINPAFEKGTGWKTDEWVGKPFTQIVHPDDSIAALKMFQQVLQGEEATMDSLRVRKNDGSYNVVELSVMPQHLNSKLVGALGIARDISKVQDIQNKLNQTETQYQKLIELNPDAAGVHVDGKLVYINDAGARLFGAQDATQLLNKPMVELIHPDFRAAAEARFSKLQQNGKVTEIADEKLLRFDGSEIDVTTAEVPVIYKKNQAVKFVFREKDGIAPAESSQMNGQEAESLLDQLPDAAFINDIDGGILQANLAACQMYTIEKDGLVGKDFLDLVPVDLRESISQNIYLMTHQRMVSCDTTTLKSTGGRFPIRLWARRVDFAGKTGVLLIVRDISDQSMSSEEKEKLAKESKAAKQKLHEISQKLQTANSKFEQTEFKLQNMQLEFEDLQLKLKSAQLQHEQAQARVEAFQQKETTQIQEIEALRQQIADSEARFSDAEARLEALQNERQSDSTSSRELQTNNQVLQAKLKNAELKIKKLSGLVPISPLDKQIRDDHAFWQRIGEAMEDPATLSLIEESSADFKEAAAEGSTELNNGLQE